MNIDTFLSQTLHLEPRYVVDLVVAVVLGGLIGLERELRDKPAGFRTIILICVGSCLFTMISRLIGGADQESTRIAAQVVTGIGFLGAGAILRDRADVIGLTTAATIWAVAAIGMAVGFHQITLGVLGTLVILIALWGFDIVEHRIGQLRDIQEFYILTDNNDDPLQRLNAVFADAGLHIRKRTCYEEGPALVFHIVAMGSKANHDRLRMFLVRSEKYTLRSG